MSANRVLEDTFREILDVIKPVNTDWVMRFQVVEELQAIVRSVETLRGATAEPFGSFVSNLFAKSGDLDISIELANGSFVSSSGKKEKLKLLRALMKAMRRRGGWEKFNFIPHARVPILKVESHIQNISCDISIDNLQAQMKSKFMLWISDIDTRFRDMVLLVKEWAKAHNINNPRSGTFNSFSLSLLVIFHFQTCEPAIFPPLQDIYPGNIAEDLKGLRASAESRIAETCKANIKRFRFDRNNRAINKSSLSELFISFLAKFSAIGSSASDWGICPFTGQWQHIKSITRWLPQTYAIFVEDPFEQPENSARSVSAAQLTRISEMFKTSYNRLSSANLSKNALLAMLAQEKTFELIAPRSPVYNHNNVTYDHPSGSHGQRITRLESSQTTRKAQVAPPPRVVHYYSQVQPQSQTVQFRSQSNGSIGSNGSMSSEPSARKYHGQGPQQQMWKPRSSR